MVMLLGEQDMDIKKQMFTIHPKDLTMILSLSLMVLLEVFLTIDILNHFTFCKISEIFNMKTTKKVSDILELQLKELYQELHLVIYILLECQQVNSN